MVGFFCGGLVLCCCLYCQFVVVWVVEMEVLFVGEGEYWFVDDGVGCFQVLLGGCQIVGVQNYQWVIGYYWFVGGEIIVQVFIVEFGVGWVVVGECLVEYGVVKCFVVGDIVDVEFDVVDVVVVVVCIVYGGFCGEGRFSIVGCSVVVLNKMVSQLCYWVQSVVVLILVRVCIFWFKCDWLVQLFFSVSIVSLLCGCVCVRVSSCCRCRMCFSIFGLQLNCVWYRWCRLCVFSCSVIVKVDRFVLLFCICVNIVVVVGWGVCVLCGSSVSFCVNRGWWVLVLLIVFNCVVICCVCMFSMVFSFIVVFMIFDNGSFSQVYVVFGWKCVFSICVLGVSCGWVVIIFGFIMYSWLLCYSMFMQLLGSIVMLLL